MVVAARELCRGRAEAMSKLKGGLRARYRTFELPGANPLKDAHAALDTAILTAYGFNAKKNLPAQLLALNQEVAAKIKKGSPVTAPGVTRNYPDAKKLVTEDCIRRLLNPNAEVEAGRSPAVRGAHAAGGSFSAARRKFRPPNLLTQKEDTSMEHEGWDGPPQPARGPRALPIPTRSSG